MSIDEFNSLNEEERKVAIFEAEKVSERKVGSSKYELFRIDNFYVEVKTSLLHSFKRLIKAIEREKISPQSF